MKWTYLLCKMRPQLYIACKLIRTQSSTVDLAHRIYGPSPTPDSEPIFVLHGILGSKRNWKSMCTKIAAYTNKPVIAVDARNHGDSPHNDAHSYNDLAADVSQLIIKLSIKKSIIIGHSMGGRTGMVLALTEPSKVASLIVVDISPVPTPPGSRLDFFPKVLDVMMTVNFQGLNTLNEATAAAKNIIMKSQLFQNEDAMYFILMNVGKLSDNSYGWKCNLDALQKNFPQIASFPNLNGKTYNGPTLFIGGKQSDFIPPDDISRIHRLFPKAHLLYIDGVGHNVHAEDPNAFFNTVINFLSYNAKNQAQI